MIISLIGLAIYAALLGFVVYKEPDAYVELIIFASFLMGLTGSHTTFLMGAFSFVADTTEPIESNPSI